VNFGVNARIVFVISVAKSVSDFLAARRLFQEYAAGLGIDLSFQNFAQELENISTIYGKPDGCLLLARQDNEIVGCVGFRPFDVDVCEMKRLYVRPSARGTGIGRQLVTELIYKVRAAAYRTIVLDTLPSMPEAQSLYRSLGFRITEPRGFSPFRALVYMQLDLG
jgi:ribosomal protein S18 acetylase RimI-like enzyme